MSPNRANPDDALHMHRPPVPAIQRLIDKHDLNSGDLDHFVGQQTFPIIDGPTATFVWRGHADHVRIIHWIYSIPPRIPFHRVRHTDLWYLTIDLPENSRVEYKLEIVTGQEHRLIEDPLNPRKSYDPFGSNSVCLGQGYGDPDWARPDPEARPGQLEERNFYSRNFGDERRVTLYLPARFRRTRRYPLLITHDGGDFLHFASMKTVLDNLIHRLEIPEMVVALTHPKQRLQEYAHDERHDRFLTEELVPNLEQELPLMGTPVGRCLHGASFGAVASLSAAVRFPGFYGGLLLQSGSFGFTDIGKHKRGPLFDPVVQFVNGYRAHPSKVVERIYLSCGIYESLIYENRSMVPLFQGTGTQVRYEEARDGHNWENWRDRLRVALSWLSPGPLWMVYE